jgi:hypothetical protein
LQFNSERKYETNHRLTALIAVAALVLSGCVAVTDSEAPEPIAPVASPAPFGFESFYNQIVEFEPCGEKLFCADIQVPMNWDDGQSEPITIATVYRAADKKNNSGFILFNPGGPGASGYNWVKESSAFLGTKKTSREFQSFRF